MSKWLVVFLALLLSGLPFLVLLVAHLVLSFALADMKIKMPDSLLFCLSVVSFLGKSCYVIWPVLFVISFGIVYTVVRSGGR